MMEQGFKPAVRIIGVAVSGDFPRGQYPSIGIDAAGAFRPTSEEHGSLSLSARIAWTSESG